MPEKPDPATLPCSPLDETCGLAYFPRMLAKIRLHASGQLWEELVANLCKGQDASCVDFLHLTYEQVKARTLEGGSDDEVFDWCLANGRELNDTDKLVWRSYINKLGWNDHITKILAGRKAESGLEGRDDIQTMPHYIDVDEGRKA